MLFRPTLLEDGPAGGGRLSERVEGLRGRGPVGGQGLSSGGGLGAMHYVLHLQYADHL